jgi:transposase
MIPLASELRVWIATGHTDMRRGMNTLGLQVREALKRDPHGGDLTNKPARPVRVGRISRSRRPTE